MSTKPYIPAADSVAARCIAYFRRLPDEELSTKDIGLKYSVDPKNVLALLEAAVDAEFLSRDGVIYSAGKQLKAAPAAAPQTNVFGPAIKRAAANKTSNSPRTVIDFDALTVDEGVPHLARTAPGCSKWEPVFLKLTAPGLSIQLPDHVKGAVAAAAAKRNREKRGIFEVGLDGKGQVRVWRTS